MGTGSASGDIIARLKVVTDQASVDAAAANIRTAIQQLSLPQNKGSLTKLLGLDPDSVTAEMNKIGQAINSLEDKQRAAQIANDFITKAKIRNLQEEDKAAEALSLKLIALYGKEEKAKQAAVDAQEQATQKALQNAKAAADNLDQVNLRRIDQENKLAKAVQDSNQAQAKAQQDALQNAKAAADNLDQVNLRRIEQENRLAEAVQKSAQAAAQAGQNFIQALSQGNLGSVWKQVLSGDIAGMNLGGGFAQMGGGLLKSLGIDAATNVGLATVTGGVLALGQAILTLGSAYLEAYQKGQQWLSQTEQLRKQIGLTADQATQQRSLMVFSTFGQADSPFANIVFSQLQGNLQMLADFEDGLTVATPQILKMAEGMQRLGLEARDSKGHVKDVVQFTLEMSKALQGLDPARYSQAIQEISGLFGINFASVAGTAPADLQKLVDSSVKVSEEMLRLSDTRTVAITAANNAEMQFNLRLTEGLIPLDIQIQRLKERAFWVLAGDPRGKVIDMANLPPGENTFAAALGIAIQRKLGMIPLEAPTEAPSTPALPPDVSAKIKSNAILVQDEARILKATSDLVKAGMDADTAATKAYTDELRGAATQISRAAQEQSKLVDANNAAATSFDNILSHVISSSKSYDTFYKQYADTYKTIDDLTSKSNTLVKTFSYKDPQTGQTTALTGSLKDIEKYYNDFNKEAAADLKQSEINQAQAEKIVDQANTTKKKTLTASQQLRYGWLTTGTDPVAMVREAWDTKQLAERAVALGIPEGAQVSTESLVSTWRKAGLSKYDQDQLAAAWEQIKQLNQQNAESGFNVLLEGMGKYVKTLGPVKDELGNIVGKEQDFLDGSKLMADTLQNFAESAGLFESVGFARALSEAALQAQLLSNGFRDANGNILDATGQLIAYSEKQEKIYGLFKDYADYISGRLQVTPEAMIGAGILPADLTTRTPTKLAAPRQPGVYNPEMEYATPGEVAQVNLESYQQNLADLAKAGKISSQQFTKLMLEANAVDITSGIKQIYDQAYGGITKAGLDSAKNIAKDVADALANPFVIKLKVDPSSYTEIKQALQDALGNVPPITSKGGARAFADATTIAEQMGIEVPEGLPLEGVGVLIKNKITEIKTPGYQVPKPVADRLNGVLGITGMSGENIFPSLPPAAQNNITIDAILNNRSVDQIIKDLQDLTADITDEARNDPLLQAKFPALPDSEEGKNAIPVVHDTFEQMMKENPLLWPIVFSYGALPAPPAPPPGTGTGAGGEGVVPPAGTIPAGATGTGGAVYIPPPAPKNQHYMAPYGESGVGFIPPFYDIPVYTAPSSRISGPSTNVNIDARGSTSPSDTARAVEKATGIFFSDDPQVAARDIRRRKGYTW